MGDSKIFVKQCSIDITNQYKAKRVLRAVYSDCLKNKNRYDKKYTKANVIDKTFNIVHFYWRELESL